MSADEAGTEAGTMPDATDLKDEIDKKLSQAAGILAVAGCARDFLDKGSEALGALESLLDETEKAFEELHSIYLVEHTPKEVQE